MNYNWIVSSGSCTINNICEVIDKVDINKTKYIAMLTDAFLSGVGSKFDTCKSEILRDQLIEIRFFCEEYELLITRGYIGEDFSWRIATESTETEEKVEYIEDKHYIDINTKFQEKSLDNGNIEIMSTVGGKYELPITNEKKVKIINYIDYDENGMAKIVDSRICCFV